MPESPAAAPRFSVVVPAYQAQSTLSETLDAILAQAYVDWECIVVDDGSTDGTLRVASTYASRDPRMRVLHQENQGTAGACNAGVSAASGDFVVICSADDILLPEHLSTMSAFIDAEEGYDIYSSNGYVWEPGYSRETFYGADEGKGILSLELADVIHSCFFSVGAAYRRGLFAAVGGYRLGVYGEDYDFWLRAMASGARHRYLPEPLSLHRVSPTQKSAHLEAVFRSDIRLVSDLRRDFPLSAKDRRAVDESISDREHRIAELSRPQGFAADVVRRVAKRIAVALVGPQRARRVSRTLRSRIGHKAPR
jgi:glycosyltransferase involved in cell wall biosynthesis